MIKIDLLAFNEQVELKNITARKHPEHDLIIWNYTPQCQYENAWNDVTMQARGLITTSDGTIVARPFKKFFNIEQYEELLPLEPFTVTEKMDGSLGILYFVDNKPYIATRGSFTSEQAVKANEILHKKYKNILPSLLPCNTYLFEIIYPQNRIVVDYGDREDLVLLAVINTETGKEYRIHDVESITDMITLGFFSVVKHYDGINDITTLESLEEKNKEGFVIRFESGLRLKCKFNEYKRLHRLLTQCTARNIWEILKNGESLDSLLERVPDEFYQWVKQTEKELTTSYTNIEAMCHAIAYYVRDFPTRKEQAAVITKHAWPGITFSMLDNKNYNDALWKLLYPAASRPFKIDEEG